MPCNTNTSLGHRINHSTRSHLHVNLLTSCFILSFFVRHDFILYSKNLHLRLYNGTPFFSLYHLVSRAQRHSPQVFIFATCVTSEMRYASVTDELPDTTYAYRTRLVYHCFLNTCMINVIHHYKVIFITVLE